jgi:hypothetical protein
VGLGSAVDPLLHRAALAGAVAPSPLGTELGVTTPPVDLDTATGAQALDAVHGLLDDLFPQLKGLTGAPAAEENPDGSRERGGCSRPCPG